MRQDSGTVKWFNADIRAVDAALQKTPEVLKAVGVNATVDVLNRMVDHLMRELSGQSLIGKQRVSIERGTRFDVFAYLRLQGFLSAVRNNRSADLTAALQDSHHGRFVFRSGSGNALRSFALVHVPRLTADKSFVRLALTG
jgi:hypothetical protein